MLYPAVCPAALVVVHVSAGSPHVLWALACGGAICLLVLGPG